MVSAVGNDERGQEAVAILNGFGIDTSLIQVDAQQPTGSVGIELGCCRKAPVHDPRKRGLGPFWHGPVATGREDWRGKCRPISETLGQRGTSSRATIRRALDAAKAAGVLCILDVNLRAPFFSLELIREVHRARRCSQAER